VQTKKLAPGSVGMVPDALRFLYRVTLKRGWVPGDIPMPQKAAQFAGAA
jgi:integrase/recombinase XerD